MKHHIRLIAAVALSIVFGSCKQEQKKAADFNSPFYRVFEGESKGKKYVIHLYRSPPSDTSLGPAYSGTFYDNEKQEPEIFSSETSSELPQNITIGFGRLRFNVTINADGNKLKGMAYTYSGSASYDATDSGQFTAVVTEPGPPFKYYGAAGAFRSDTTEDAFSLDYRYGVLVPTFQDAAVNRLIRRGIYKHFNLADTVLNPLDRLLDFSAFQNNPDAGEEPESEISRSESTFSEVVFLGKRWLSLKLSSSFYEMGMNHDQGFNRYPVFDLATGSTLSLQDILTPAGRRKLPSLLAACLREQRGLSAGESLTKAGLHRNSISASDQFSVTDKGISFHYDPYQVAVFAEGDYHLFIPFSNFAASDLTPAFQTGR